MRIYLLFCIFFASFTLKAQIIDDDYRVKIVKNIIAKEKVTFEIIKSDHYFNSYLVHIYNEGTFVGEYNPKMINKPKEGQLSGIWNRLVTPEKRAQKFVDMLTSNEIDFDAFSFEFMDEPDSATKNLRIKMVNLVKF